MIVRVQTFGPLRETLGEWVEVEAETVADVKRAVPGTYAVAVNLEYAGDEVVIGEGDEVALIPPVSGGGGRGGVTGMFAEANKPLGGGGWSLR